MECLYEVACPIWIVFFGFYLQMPPYRGIPCPLRGWAHVRLSKPAISDIASIFWIFLGMLEPCGAYMGPCWAHVRLSKPAISDIAAIFWIFFGYVGAMCGLHGTMLGPCNALGTSYIRYSCNFWCILGPCWAHVGPIWDHVRLFKSAISDIAAFFGVCWGHVGPTWDHVGPMLCF